MARDSVRDGDKARFIHSGALWAVLALVITAGCQRVERSEELSEPGRVEFCIFVPGGTGSSIEIVLDNGQPTIQTSQCAEEDRYAVVFRCKHGKFVIQGSDSFHHNLWSRMTNGEPVIIKYRERWIVEGKEPKIERTFDDFEFVNAFPLPESP